jgi:hypothetical protein
MVGSFVLRQRLLLLAIVVHGGSGWMVNPFACDAETIGFSANKFV